MNSMRQVIIYPDLEDGGYVVEVPSLPGCVSQGDTREEALANARDAIAVWVDSAKSLKLPVPKDRRAVEICEV
jgi:predicted RNase H-like HicB family nuclease